MTSTDSFGKFLQGIFNREPIEPREHTAPEFLSQAVRELKKLGGQSLRQAVAEPIARFTVTHTAILQQPVEESNALAASAEDPQFLAQPARETVSLARETGKDEILAQAVRELVASVPWGHHANVFGKMDFYLNILNDKERAPDDQPSIGIILCAEKNDIEVEFALKTKTNPKAEIDAEAWATLNSDTSRPFDKPKRGRIAVKVINHLGDEVMKVFSIS